MFQIKHICVTQMKYVIFLIYLLISRTKIWKITFYYFIEFTVNNNSAWATRTIGLAKEGEHKGKKLSRK